MSTAPKADIEWIDTCPSTSTLLINNEAGYGHGKVIATHSQTAGRGQRGNSWEAEPGKNLTFSILLRPTVLEAARSFELSMIVALALAEVLEPLAGQPVEVKWPNDIYVADRKLCGILIENAFCGSKIERSVVGIGINVNQRQFYSDAPNPVSLLQISGQEIELKPLLAEICDRILADLATYEAVSNPQVLSAKYHSRLWRRNGSHRWIDNLTGETFTAAIESVALSGHLTLAATQLRTYTFKEVSPL